jgi:MYXO-CTERM domain-containing protein
VKGTYPKSIAARELPRPGLLALLAASVLLSGACGPEQSSRETFSTRSNASGLASERWQSTAPLARARFFHTATLMEGGKLLVTGGALSDDGVLSHVELYDSTTGKWGTTAPLAQPRIGHSATRLSGGRILVVGGWNGDAYTASAELYDPRQGTWTATGSLNEGRQYHTATELPDGKVLVAGGWNDSFTLTSAELYDPATGKWTLTGALSHPRDSHTATLLPNGKVLVTGGWGTTSHLASAELYDPATGKWTAAPPLKRARGYHTATRLKNDKVLVSGGYNEASLPASAELYDPATGQWEDTAPLGQARFYHAATLLQDGRVLVSGGAGGATTPIASAELYDPATGQWTSIPSMAEARSMHTTTLLPSGRVIALGGKGTQALSSAELFVSGGDVTPPETRIDSAPASPTRSTSATFTFSANESGATFECSWEGAPFSACTSPATFQPLAEGSHTFQVRARDAAGNVDATPEARTVRVDLTPPDTRLDSTPPGESYSTLATFSFSATEGGATFECKLDGASFRACVSPTALTGLSRGTHTFQVRARDAVGNWDTTPASHTWTILTPALPAPAISSLNPGTTLSESQPTFSGTAPPGSTVIITLDGVELGSTQATSSGEWRFTVPSSLAEGEHTLVVTARYDGEEEASSSLGPLPFTLKLSEAPPAPAKDGTSGCSVGAGGPSLLLAWLTLLAATSARRRRRP